MNEESLFQQAIAIQSPQERMRFLEQACADQSEQRDNVLALLAAHDSDDPLLDRSNGLAETNLLASQTMPDQIGRQIGHYKLLQQIGQGGFGVVFLAEETRTINRRVALKIIKPGMGSKEVIARFQAERQALAMMEHDNIARVYGGGTTDDGLP